MTQYKHLAQDWTVSDACREKVRIKYEIKQLEYHLKRFVSNHSDLALDLDELTSTCQALAQHYKSYIECIHCENQIFILPDKMSYFSEYWHDCYRQLEAIKNQWVGGFPNDKDWAELYKVQRLYQHLAELCHYGPTKAIKSEPRLSFPSALKSLIQANSPETWLNSVVTLANQNFTSRLEDDQPPLSHLGLQPLTHLCHLLSRTDVIEMTHTIFFYQLYPEQLFMQPAHPEKIISAKTRLALLYGVIVRLHQSTTNALIQKGHPPIPDYLFHTDELPTGIEIQANTEYRASVLLAVKSLQAHSQTTQETDRTQQIQAMFRAYRYWFNPNRLIDAAMILRQQFTAQAFEQEMLTLYQELSTNECLDLYGYFSNKDTCYFMRTLLAIKQDLTLPGIQEISPENKKSIADVYQTLECVMNALRDELSARHFKTKAYKRHLNPEKIVPGRRNRQAVARIITLYARNASTPNTTIESLFNAIETN